MSWVETWTMQGLNMRMAMKLFASSLTEEALDWFRGLPDNHLMSYEAFSNLFKSRWSTKIDGGMLGAQFNQIKKKENETVKEFNTRFDRLYNQIPTEFLSYNLISSSPLYERF
jgi:hypothetical protein